MVLHDLRVGGAERVMLRLAGALSDRGASLEVVTLRGGGPLAAELPAGVRHVALGARRVATSLPRLAQKLRAARPDAVISTLPHVNVATALALRLARSPARLVLREANDPTFEHALSGRFGHANGWLTRLAYTRAGAVVALTHGNAEALTRVLGVPPERVTVIPNPAPPPADDPVPRSIDGLPEGAPRILCVARLARQKDHDTLLQAFARLLSSEPGAVLALLGDGPERHAIEARARALGVTERLHLAGTVVDTGPWWAWADLMVLSSRWEGFPNVLLEALQHGVPIVATDCPSGPREVLDDGRFGELAPVADPVALAAAVQRALADPPSPEAMRSRAADYGLAGVTERWWALLEGSA